MALIKCTECGKEFSDKANACPNCGCPTEKMTSSQQEALKQTEEENNDADIVETQDNVAPQEPQMEKKKNPNIKKIIIGIFVSVVLIGAAIFFLTMNSRKYSAANTYFNDKNYDMALETYENLGDYKDAAEKVYMCKYASANSDFDANKFDIALEKYEALGDYKDSTEKVDMCKYELSVDGEFMRALANGLMARWDKSDEYAANGIIGEDPNIYAEYCQLELDNISSFANKTFDNESLNEDAKLYIDLLNKAKDATKYYTIDYNTYSIQWSEVYAERTILLQKMINDYNLHVDDKHQHTLDDMMIDASAAKEQKEAIETIHKMANECKLVESEDEWGYKDYKVEIKNSTNMTFDYFYIDITVLDETGKIIDTGSISQITSWKPNQIAEVDAYFMNQLDENYTISEKTLQFTPHYATGTLFE